MGVSKIEQLIDGIYDFIDGCRTQALSSNKVIVPKDTMYDLLDELRLRTPDEIKRYQKIIANRDAIISDAEAKANTTLADAEAQASKLVSNHEITQRAYEQANEIMEKASTDSNEMVTSAKAESEKILNEARAEASELIKSAKSVANNMVKTAKEESSQMVSESYEYANELLYLIEKVLNDAVVNSKTKFDSMYKVLTNSLAVVKDNREQINAQMYDEDDERVEKVENKRQVEE